MSTVCDSYNLSHNYRPCSGESGKGTALVVDPNIPAVREGRFRFVFCKQTAAAVYVCVGGGGGVGEGRTPHYTSAQGHIFTHSHSQPSTPTHAQHACRLVGIEAHVVFKVTSECKSGTCSRYCVF